MQALCNGPRMSSAETRILHIHIPKTAGTALRTAFQDDKDRKFAVFPGYDERQLKNVEAEQYDIFSGHFGYSTAARIGGRMVTVLRDPVDRFVSVYFFWRQLHAQGIERNHKTALAVHYDLHEFAKLRDEQLLAEEFFNRATWQIAHGSSTHHRCELHDQGVTDAALLDRARDNLHGFAAVGFQDDIGSFNRDVARLAGRPLPMRQINITRERPDVSDVPDATRRLIEGWTYLDIELLRMARLAGAPAAPLAANA